MVLLPWFILTTFQTLNTMRKEESLFLYAIFKGYKMNVGKIIETSILNYYCSNYRDLMSHPTTITKLCILGGVEGNWEEEERCSRTSPLTLQE